MLNCVLKPSRYLALSLLCLGAVSVGCSKPAPKPAATAAAPAVPESTANSKAETKEVKTLADAPLIPRDVLFGNPQRAQARLSPDGKWLSFQAPVDGVMNIWVGRSTTSPRRNPSPKRRSAPSLAIAGPTTTSTFSTSKIKTATRTSTCTPPMSKRARRKTSRRSKACAPRSRKSATNSRTRFSSASTTATRAITTFGGSTSRPARSNSCRKTPASPAT